MKIGQDFMRKASSMILSKAPETESTDEQIQPQVCYLYFYFVCIIMFITYNFSLKKIKNSAYVKQC